MNNIEGARAAQDAALEQDTYTTNDTPLKGYSQVFDAVTFCPALSDSAYRTYMILKTHDHGHGVFPGIARLAKYQGLSRRTIQSNMEEIKALGLVTVKRRGFGRTNIYTMAFAPALSLAPARPVDDASEDAEPTPEQEKCNLLHIKRSATDDTSRSATDDTQDVQPVAHKALRSSKQTKSEAKGTGADAPPAACAAPPSPPTEKTTKTTDRKPSLRQADPALWASREAIKEAYFAEYTAEPWALLPASKQGYVNLDAERLARACRDTDEALALMRVVYDEGWRERATGKAVYRNRSPFKLSACPGKLKAFRDGTLETVGGRQAPTVSAAASRHPAYAPPLTQTADPDCPLCEGMGLVRRVVSPTEIRAARCSCVTRGAAGAGVAS